MRNPAEETCRDEGHVISSGDETWGLGCNSTANRERARPEELPNEGRIVYHVVSLKLYS